MSTSRAAVLADSLALGVSGLCLVHCLALPLAASLLPLAGLWAQAEWAHWVFVAVAAPVSLWAFLHPRTRDLGLAVLAGAGLALLVAGAAEYPSHALETPVTVAGGLVLAAAHILNWRRRMARHDA